MTLEHSHLPDEIARRIKGKTRHSYLRDFVYGAIDGTVTTFAVVSGVAGAGLQPEIVIVLGVANLVGDGFSMAASNYLGSRTDQQLREKARAMERRHIREVPEGEREEVRAIFRQKGFQGPDLERAVQIITANEERWINTMLVDELGMARDNPSPWKAAWTTFFAFCLVGFLPLVVFLIALAVPAASTTLYSMSAVVTGIAFFLTGAVKSMFVEQRWYSAGMETLAVGGAAALLAFTAGWMLRGLI